MNLVDTHGTSGALLLLFDVAAEALDEHDEWHTHEHMPERLAIPGFVRGTRWTRPAAAPRYCVVYEVTNLAVLDGAAYRQRLDHPTPWTSAMMARYAGMRRTLCRVTARAGVGLGAACLVVTFAPADGGADALRQYLLSSVVPHIPCRRGLASCALLESALAAQMTREQAIRGQDRAVHAALWVTGYDEDALAALAQGDLGTVRLRAHGATEVEHAIFTLAYALDTSAAASAREQ
jgi:hypothetical protein